jgi:glycosyltransferase involved in cell wall biosynthesis
MVLTKDVLRPHVDGRVYKEAKTLVDNGYQVSILCRVYSLDSVEAEEEYEGIKVIRQLCSKSKSEYTSRIEQLFQNLTNARTMADRIIKLKPDIIHAHDLNALLESVLAKRKLGIPLVYDSHEDWPKLEQTKGNNLAYLSALTYEKFLLGHVSNVITVNPILANKFVKNIPTTILYNYPKLSQFKPKTETVNRIKNQYNLNDKIVIEYHGVIGRVKGFDILIEATERLVKKYDNLQVLLIGPDFEKYINDKQVKRLKDHVVFTGPVDYDLIPSYIAASDISFLVLQPTTQYLVSTPTKLFEAMLIGKPVVANAEFPEVVRIVGDDQKQSPGVLVNFDINEIIIELETLIENKNLRTILGKNGQKKALKYYTWEKQEHELLKLYKKI